jgi:hypothetical protein
MARRVDDTEDRPPGRDPAARHPEVEAASSRPSIRPAT